MKSFVQGLQVEKRVIMALILREVHTIYGESKLGYLWVLIQSAFGIAVFWAVREFAGASDPHGMPVAVFLIIGFGVWTVIGSSISKVMSAVQSNLTLLTFPQVTELDVMVSRVIVIYVTQLLVSVILIGAVLAFGLDFKIVAPGLFFAVIALVPLFGLGAGLVLASLAVFIPVLERIVPLVLRMLFFVSGVFFSVSAFSSDISEVLSYNPILQLIELLRSALSAGYPADETSLSYASLVTMVCLSLGLLLERYVRSRRDR